MKLIIFAEGGEAIGFGHLSRCLALAQAIKEINSAAEVKFICKIDKSAEDFLDMHEIEWESFDWIKDFDGLVQDISKDAQVIIDSYLAPKRIYDRLSKKVNGNILMIDDYSRIEYPAGIVVNPSIYGKQLKYPEKKDVKYLLGKDYIILRKEFWEVPEKKIKEEVKTILVTFGGMAESDLTDKIIHSLDSYRFNFISIDASKKKHTAADMLKYMLDADICISGGGQTTYELARVGVPTIGICFAENQKGNLEYGDLSGYLKYIENSSNSLVDKIKDRLEEIISFEQRDRMSSSGRNNIDGRGTKRIAEKIVNVNKAS